MTYLDPMYMEHVAPNCHNQVPILSAIGKGPKGDKGEKGDTGDYNHDSMLQFISALESYFNINITETNDSENNRYTYSIESS